MLDKSTIVIARMFKKNNRKKFILINMSLCIAFIILITLSYITVTFHISYKQKMKNDPILLSCKMRTTGGKYTEDIMNLIENNKGIKENRFYKYTYISFYKESEYLSFMAPSKTYYSDIKIDETIYKSDINKSYDIFDYYDDLNNVVLDVENDYGKKNNKKYILAQSEGESSSKDIYINSKFCDKYNMDYNAVVGKSITYNLYTSKTESLKLIENFTIKGVFNSELYSLPTRNETQDDSPLFWLSSSVFNEILSKKNFEHQDKNIVVFKNFSSLEKTTQILSAYYEENVINSLLTICSATQNCLDVMPLLIIAQYILFTISIFILVVGIINLFHVIVYIVSKESKFLDMCHKIGMRNGERNKFTLYQNVIIFGETFILQVVGSFILSIILTKRYNEKIDIEGIFSDFVLFNIKYYFMVLAIFILLFAILIFLLSKAVDKYISSFKNI